MLVDSAGADAGRNTVDEFYLVISKWSSGQEVIVARHGKPVARLVAVEPKKSILGMGVGDTNYTYNLPDEAWFQPMDKDELALWYREEHS